MNALEPIKVSAKSKMIDSDARTRNLIILVSQVLGYPVLFVSVDSEDRGGTFYGERRDDNQFLICRTSIDSEDPAKVSLVYSFERGLK